MQKVKLFLHILHFLALLSIAGVGKLSDPRAIEFDGGLGQEQIDGAKRQKYNNNIN